MISFTEYQEFCKTTAIYPKERGLEYVALGLCSEAGEAAGKVKKVLRDENGFVSELRKVQILDEVGDALWYCANLCSELGADLSTVVQRNVDKLSSRKERGTLSGSGDNR